MGDSWDEYAEGWEEQAGVKDYAEQAFLSLQAAVSLSPDHAVLDFGCGTGLLTEKIAPLVHSVVSIDASAKMIDVLTRKNIPNVSSEALFLSEATIAEKDILHPKFDLIVASSALAFVDDYEKIVTLLKSLLAPGGTLVQWDWLLSSGDTDGMGFTEERIRAAYNAAGLSVVSVSQPFGMPAGDSVMRVVMGVARL